MTETRLPEAEPQRRRESPAEALDMLDIAVMLAVDRLDVDPEVLIARVSAVARWAAAGDAADALLLPCQTQH